MGGNLAVRVAGENRFNKSVRIIDVEGKHGSHKVFSDNFPEWAVDASKNFPTVLTPSGGMHIYSGVEMFNMDEVEKEMRPYQSSPPVVITYALIPPSMVAMKNLNNKAHVYLWSDDFAC